MSLCLSKALIVTEKFCHTAIWIFFNWNSLQAKLRSHQEANSCKKKKKKEIKSKQEKMFTKNLKMKGVC